MASQMSLGSPPRAGATRAGLLFVGALVAILHVLTSSFLPFSTNNSLVFSVVEPIEKADGVVIHPRLPDMGRFRVGDRVRAMHPMLISNSGRGYYNEGAALSVPEHQRIAHQDAAELAALPKVVEGGEEGVVVGILPAGEWFNRPKHVKGRPRPLVMVCWDNAVYPIDMAEETFLEQLPGSVSDMHRMKHKLRYGRRSLM
eukprot:TRINITY_DN25701_c0_g2_i1.p1 TRINITY_DN25701_c0_g2~~TRINITY_DN25701_c0_g2_i1.p1  ORF type:complete len:223 (-),score=31.09 TRINITY_DN25701_c0_g2_i1:165-764(-)